MEDNLQRVFSILISILILFILPLYIAFEKMDDISYSLALKITSNFVDNVTAKGYLTKEMYNDYISRLSVTGNVYDVKMEHVAKKYEPALFVYNDKNRVISILDYSLFAEQWTNSEDSLKLSSRNVAYSYKKSDIKLSYNTSEIKYTQEQILKVLNSSGDIPYSKMSLNQYSSLDKKEITTLPYMYANYKLNDDGNMEVDNENRIYTMNKGDEFSVRIKNENVTIATVLFNAFTLGIGGTENNVRVYINYGGTIKEEEYKNLENNNDKVFMLGDVNGDGTVNVLDVTLLEKYLSKEVNLSSDQLKSADVNQDEIIDIKDLTSLKQMTS